MKPGCSSWNFVDERRGGRIEVHAFFSSLVVSHDWPEITSVHDYRIDHIWSGYIVKLSLFKPDAFPAWSDDFSKSPLCGTVSSAQSGSSVFIGCELPQCVEIENIMLKSQNTPTCQYFSDLLWANPMPWPISWPKLKMTKYFWHSYIREGFRKKTEKLCPFDKPPSD